MKKLFGSVFMLLLAAFAFLIISCTFSEQPVNETEATPQIFNPVKWSYSVEVAKSGEIELVFTAKIEEGWHLYSQDIPDGGPIPTSFKFNASNKYELVGKVNEPKAIEEEDPNFGMTLKYFEHEVKFRQKVKAKTDKKFTIDGELEFMVCDDQRCLPPDYLEFKFDIEPAKQKEEGQKGSIEPAPSKDNDNNPTAKENTKEPEKLQESELVEAPPTMPQNEVVIKQAEEKSEAAIPVHESETSNLSFWMIFIKGFIGGLFALLTPCVFPMIPMTVSFFTKRSKDRAKGITNAFIYGFFIIAIYTGLGLAITLTLGADALNDMASSAFFNLLFFFILVIFGLSFLGAFEITLPSSWVNKADTASDKGGLLGIFFMAFTLSLVSFSCTGPIVGTLLVDAALGGNVAGPAVGMFGFSLALALPFGLFAAFPGWMNSLPKSGGWLNSVKVTLGILELALALKFISNVDLAYHWGIITREVFIALWIVIFGTLGFYLLGKIRFSHDSKTEYISIPRYLMAVVIFAFVVYLIPGLWGAPLKLISGFPPPKFYTEGSWAQASNGDGVTESTSAEVIEGVDRSHCPHGLTCFHDYDLALEYARKVDKPLMVDFTGWSCVNCRKMEDNVWIDPRVWERLENKYVLVSLYVDDKTPLPKGEHWVSEVTGKRINTIGRKWSEFQTRVYKTNSQPYYVLLDHEEKPLASTRAYDPDIEDYINWLDSGVKEFKEREKQELSSL